MNKSIKIALNFLVFIIDFIISLDVYTAIDAKCVLITMMGSVHLFKMKIYDWS